MVSLENHGGTLHSQPLAETHIRNKGRKPCNDFAHAVLSANHSSANQSSAVSMTAQTLNQTAWLVNYFLAAVLGEIKLLRVVMGIAI